jgi:hypothetical protein
MRLHNYFLCIVLTMLGVFPSIVCSPEEIVDAIIAIVYGAQGVELITKSDLNRPTLMGQTRTLDDLVFDKALLLDAKKRGLHVDDAMVEQYMAALQQAHNLTRDDVRALFKEAGYTYEEGLEQLRTIQIINSLLQVKINEQILTSQKDVEEYYQAHPEYEERRYHLQLYTASKDEAALYTEQHKAVPFSGIFSLKASEIAFDRRAISEMNVGEVIQFTDENGNIDFIKLVARDESYLIPLEKRRREILAMLQETEYNRLLSEYRQGVLQNITVVYTA